MKQADYVKYLGRPLTPVEVSSFDLYNSLAVQNLETVLCIHTCDDEDPKRFDVRVGYRTVFLDIFTSITSVTLDGTELSTDQYTVSQFGKWQADWYNSIVLKYAPTNEDSILLVSASWGFNSMPKDLQMLQAQLFDMISEKNHFDGSVSSKKVEDFQVTFTPDADLDAEFYSKYKGTIDKYSLCNIPYVKHGDLHDCI